jgi:hypothetical protein
MIVRDFHSEAAADLATESWPKQFQKKQVPEVSLTRLGKVLTETKLARSGSEATRLIKQGAVSVGGCEEDCMFRNTGNCSCKGWRKITDPVAMVESGLAVKIGSGLWRLMNRAMGEGWDQVNGIGRVP